MKRIVCFLLMMTSLDVLADLYRYRNDEGALVISQSIPAELANNGYEVLSSDGSRVLRVVPRALTEEELEAANLNAETLRLQAEEEARRKKEDEILLRLYSSPGDVIYARDIKLKETDKQISRIQNRQGKSNEQKKMLMAEAANLEREGKRIDDILLDRIAAIDASLKNAALEVDKLSQEKAQMVIKYNDDYERIKELYGITRVEASTLPAEGAP